MDAIEKTSEKISKKNRKCSVGVSFENDSCLPLDALIIISQEYNKSFPNNRIQVILGNDDKEHKKYLIKEINKRIPQCRGEHRCWVRQDFIKNAREKLELFFSPDGPNEGSIEWLNTIHINEAMRRTENMYDDFKYLGTVPIDFIDLPTNYYYNGPYIMSNFSEKNISKIIKSGKTKCGCIFNLDKHNQSGSHWVSFYSDLGKGQIYFFDSYGSEPKEEIKNLMNIFRDFIKNKQKNRNIDIRENKIRHQFKGSECGVYSINFISRLLSGESFDNITNNITLDDKMNKCRDVYFY